MSFRRLIVASALITASIALPSFGSIQYKIDGERLAPLSGPLGIGAKVRLERIPIDGDLETLELERFEVFAPDADIKVLGANDEILARLPIPAIRTYRGSILGLPDSSVFLAVGPARIDGVVFRGGHRFGIASRTRAHQQPMRDIEGIDVFIQESDVLDDMPADGKGFFCDADQTALPRIPNRVVTEGLIPKAEGTLSTASARWVINLAVETDYELYVNVGSNSGNVITFITNLIGAMSTIYNRELTTEVSVASLTINSSVSDPFTVVPGASGDWNGSTVTYTSTHALLELGDRWHNTPPSTSPRSATALVSGKDVNGGIAWVDWLGKADFFFDPVELCSGAPCYPDPYRNHYGGRYSFNGGIFPGNPPLVPNPDANAPTYTAPPSNYWPLLQLSHETGHNVFSGHTHCRTLSGSDQVTYGRTFVDNCFNGEGPLGCYDGTNTLPAEKGTIMSYCHFTFGAANTRYIFGKAGEASYVMPAELKSAIQNATPSLSAITAPATLAAGASGTASVANVSGLTYLWTITNGVINSGQGTSSVNFTATSNPANVKVKATNTASTQGPQGQRDCSITDNKDVAVTGSTYSPPAGVLATAASTTSVSITWSLPAGTAPVQYDVYRTSDGVNYGTMINSVLHPATTYTDNTAVPGTAYLYTVRSAGASGISESADSNRDLATTVIFTDDPLVASTTLIKAAHITELRTAVNAVRTLAGLGSGSYTDPTLTAGATPTKAVHINDLRAALDAARSSLSLAALSYAETVTASTTTITTGHITELRGGVK